MAHLLVAGRDQKFMTRRRHLSIECAEIVYVSRVPDVDHDLHERLSVMMITRTSALYIHAWFHLMYETLFINIGQR